MADKNLSRDQLLMKIGRAQLKLEQSKVKHADRCMGEMDPDASCSCGASEANARIDAARRELDID
jgi:hypothetical protein